MFSQAFRRKGNMVSLFAKYQDPCVQQKQEPALVCYRNCGFCSERLFEQRMWYHKQNKWDLNCKWPRKPFKTYISYIYFGAGVRWCGMGGSKGLWRNPLTKLLPRWEWKEPIIALWRIKTTSANMPQYLCSASEWEFHSVCVSSANKQWRSTRVDWPPYPKGEAHSFVAA